MIISDEPKLFEILEEYEESNNEEQFKEKVLAITRPKGTLLFPKLRVSLNILMGTQRVKNIFYTFE